MNAGLDASTRWLSLLRRASSKQLGRALPDFSAQASAARDAASKAALAPGGAVEQSLAQAFTASGLDPAHAPNLVGQLRNNVAQVDGHAVSPETLDAARALAPPEVNPQHTLILERTRGIIERLADISHGERVERLKALRGRILVSTLPTGEINARAMRAPGDAGFVIVFEPAFFDFFYHFSNAFADAIDGPRAQALAQGHALGEPDPPLAQAIRWGDSAPVKALSDTLCAFVFQGVPPPNLPAYRPDAFSLAEHLREGAMAFLMAHEYAHILLGHLDGPAASSFAASQAQEIEADRLGWRMADTALARQGLPPPVRPMGATLFLISALMVEMARGAALTGEPQTLTDRVRRAATETGGSHPTAVQRLAVLSEGLFSSYPPELARGAQCFMALLLEVAQQFWLRIGPVIQSRRAGGAQPSPVWEGWDAFAA